MLNIIVHYFKYPLTYNKLGFGAILISNLFYSGFIDGTVFHDRVGYSNRRADYSNTNLLHLFEKFWQRIAALLNQARKCLIMVPDL